MFSEYILIHIHTKLACAYLAVVYRSKKLSSMFVIYTLFSGSYSGSYISVEISNCFWNKL